MIRSVSIDNYYKIKADTRDLNYGFYIEQGNSKTDKIDEYNSFNTKQLSVKEIKEILYNLDYIQEGFNWLAYYIQ